MKQILTIGFFAMAAFTACNNAPNAPEATTEDKKEAATTAGATYTIDTTTSQVGWVGTKPVGKHTGYFKISNGSLSVQDGVITGGSFNINVASLTNTDLKPDDGKDKLEGHLKSPDFFDVAKYPGAKFEITSVEALSNDTSGTHKISGNLTLKDSTKNISFPAKVSIADNNITATANFNIDRTLWGMYYGSDKSLGDKFIKPEVNLDLKINAKK
jgi:polyisoprenoid-binding protein YceI